MRSLFATSLLAGAATLALSPPARAGLTFVDVQRTVTAAAGETVDPLSLAQDLETNRSPGFQTVDAISADASYLQPQDNDFQFALANQGTRIGTVDVVELVGSGDLTTGSDDEQALARAMFETTFDLTAATPFTLAGGYQFRTDRPFRQGSLGGVSLARVGDGGATVFENSFDHFSDDPLTFDESGTLAPGRYAFTFDAGLFGPSSSGEQNAGYSFNLVLDTAFDGPGNGGGNGGGGEPNPIPLPPAVWSGLAVLGAGALNRARKSRRRRRA